VIHPHTTLKVVSFNLQEVMPLLCHYSDCRGFVRLDDYDRMIARWDADIQGALPLMFSVPQPLLDLIDRVTLESVQAYQQGRGEYRSVAVLRYSPGKQ
jgi:hypothetical protein